MKKQDIIKVNDNFSYFFSLFYFGAHSAVIQTVFKSKKTCQQKVPLNWKQKHLHKTQRYKIST